jgi:curved DNA-binding protein CbpA
MIYLTDYYKQLGINKTATKKQIRDAYLKQIKKYHPDINKDGEEISKQLNEAYQYLMSNYKTTTIIKEDTIFDSFISERDSVFNNTQNSEIKFIDFERFITIANKKVTTSFIKIGTEIAIINYYIKDYTFIVISISFKNTKITITKTGLFDALSNFADKLNE